MNYRLGARDTAVQKGWPGRATTRPTALPTEEAMETSTHTTETVTEAPTHERDDVETLQALVYDRTPGVDDPIKTYDLFYLLRHGDVEFFSRTGFDKVVPDEHADDISHLAPYVTGYCTYDGTIETNDDGYGRSVRLQAISEIYSWLRAGDGVDDETRKPRELDGIGIDVDPDGADRITSIEHLRDEMREDLDVLCYAVKKHPRQVRNQYDLGKSLFLYPLSVADEQWCAALGDDALDLHCAVQESQNAVDLESLGIGL